MPVNLETLRNLIASGDEIAERLQRGDIQPEPAATMFKAVFRAVRRELAVDNCGNEGCGCADSPLQADSVELPQIGYRMARDQQPGGVSSVLNLLAGESA